MIGAQIAHDKIDRYRSFGAFGKPAYQSHVQLRAMLKSKRGDRLANYFAKPTFDADLGELRWTVEVPGAARGWHEMSEQEQAERALDLEVVRSGLLGFVQELRAQGGNPPGGSAGGAAAFASLLEQAMKVPAQGDFLYFVGDQPVIAFWGFENQNGRSVDPAVVAPRFDVPFTPASPEPEPAPVVATAAPVRRRAWWWWLLALLLLLALLAWLLMARSCQAPPVVPVAPVMPAASAPLPEPVPSAPVVEAAPPPPEPVASAPVEPPSAGLQIPPGALERGDLSFLDGNWDFGPEMFDEYLNSPKNVIGHFKPVLRLDGQGGGTYRWTERTRHGRPVRDCVAPVKSRTDGNKLTLRIGPCVTPGDAGRPMASTTLECERDAGGQTMCYGRNNDGHRWKSPLYKMQ